MSGGHHHSIGLVGNHTIATWGANGLGQLGTGSASPPSTADPVEARLPAPAVAIAVAAGLDHNLALASDGTVFAWGNNADGQLGLGAAGGYSDTPRRVLLDTGPLPSGTPLDRVIAIGAGGNHALALRSDGTVWSWGRGVEGQLGNGWSGPLTLSPLAIQVLLAPQVPLTGIVSLASGGAHSLAVQVDGVAYAWGADGSGQVGNGAPPQDEPYPVTVRTSGARSSG